MSDKIFRTDPDLPRQDQIEDLNDMTIYLEGLVEQGRFDKNELDEIYARVNLDRKYLRNQAIGNTVSTYTGWSHLQAEDGYSIWKYSPTSYAYNVLNKIYFDGQVLSNKGEADSESATSFDSVFFFNAESGDSGTYTDNSAEAGTEGGSEFSLMDSTSDYIYLGEATTFAGTKFEWQTRGANYTLKVEYWTATGWTQLTANTNDLADNTSNFESAGRITWNIPSNWDLKVINGQNKYWIRISTTTTPTTVAKAYIIIPGDSVIALLALSSSEAQKEDWAWCSYGTAIYVTIRNAGNSAYEGDYYITSSSSASNLENFFVHNNPFTADYQDSTYDCVLWKTSAYTATANDGIILVDCTNGAITITLPSAVGIEGKQLTIKKTDASPNAVTIDGESGNFIDGSTTKSLATQNKGVTIVSDNANWYIIAEV